MLLRYSCGLGRFESPSASARSGRVDRSIIPRALGHLDGSSVIDYVTHAAAISLAA